MYKMYCPRITGNHNLEVAAAFYCLCRDAVSDAFNESMNCVENVNMTCSDDVVDQTVPLGLKGLRGLIDK